MQTPYNEGICDLSCRDFTYVLQALTLSSKTHAGNKSGRIKMLETNPARSHEGICNSSCRDFTYINNCQHGSSINIETETGDAALKMQLICFMFFFSEPEWKSGFSVVLGSSDATEAAICTPRVWAQTHPKPTCSF